MFKLLLLASVATVAGVSRGDAQQRVHPRPLTLPAAARLVDGELRCSFAGPDRAVLLLAAADVRRRARATAVMQVDRSPFRLVSTAPGGYDALTRGGSFRGAGVRAVVTRGARIEGGGEDARHAATLRVTRRSASRVVRGTWRCGP